MLIGLTAAGCLTETDRQTDGQKLNDMVTDTLPLESMQHFLCVLQDRQLAQCARALNNFVNFAAWFCVNFAG